MRARQAAPCDLERLASTDVFALKDNIAFISRIDAVDHIEQGRLTRTVRPDDAHDRACLNREIDLIQGDQAAKMFADLLNFENHSRYLPTPGRRCLIRPT